MRVLLWLVIGCVLAPSAAKAAFSSAGTFSDNFESNSLPLPSGNWDSVVTSNGVQIATSNLGAKEGLYFLRLTDSGTTGTGTTGSYVRANRTLNGNSNLMRVRFWLRLTSQTSTDVTGLVEMTNGSGQPLVTLRYHNAARNLTAAVSRPSPTAQITGGGPANTIVNDGSRWHLIELVVNGISTNNASVEIYVDGAGGAVIGTTTYLNGSNVEQVRVGMPYMANHSSTGVYDFDDIRIGTTQQPNRIQLSLNSPAAVNACVPVQVALVSNSTGNASPASSNTPVGLTSAGASASIFSNPGCTTAATSVTVLNGFSTAQAYYRLDTAGTATLTGQNASYVSGSASLSSNTQPTGSTCSAASQCSSGFCADGVCCSTACGSCGACAIAAGATTNGTCVPRAAGVQCRAGAGSCEADAVCNGTQTTCPPNVFLPVQTLCRAATADGCDAPEFCTGADATCPVDAFRPPGEVCRSADPSRSCDRAETCDGATPVCPVDGVRPAGELCRTADPSGGCDVAETCDGMTADCPADGFRPAGHVCRSVDATNACDVPETCDGTSASCPLDVGLAPAVCAESQPRHLALSVAPAEALPDDTIHLRWQVETPSRTPYPLQTVVRLTPVLFPEGCALLSDPTPLGTDASGAGNVQLSCDRPVSFAACVEAEGLQPGCGNVVVGLPPGSVRIEMVSAPPESPLSLGQTVMFELGIENTSRWTSEPLRYRLGNTRLLLLSASVEGESVELETDGALALGAFPPAAKRALRMEFRVVPGNEGVPRFQGWVLDASGRELSGPLDRNFEVDPLSMPFGCVGSGSTSPALASGVLLGVLALLRRRGSNPSTRRHGGSSGGCPPTGGPADTGQEKASPRRPC